MIVVIIKYIFLLFIFLISLLILVIFDRSINFIFL